MRLPKIAIENSQFTLMVVILLVLSGTVSFLSMPRTEDPPVSKPGTSIIVLYPGATPADMEQLAIAPLEEAVNELEDIKRIESSCEDGLAVIHVEFFFGGDPDEKFAHVNEKVNSVRDDLPADLLGLHTQKWTIEDTNFLQLALVSESSDYRELEYRADNLKKQLDRIRGIRRVKIWAFPQQEVRVSLKLEKMALLGIPLKQVIGAVQSANMNIPGGNIDSGSRQFNIKTSGSFKSISEIQNIVIHSSGSKIVFLKDIADIHLGYEDLLYFARFNGKKAVFITANQKKGTNIFAIKKDVSGELSRFKRHLPSSMKLFTVYDQSVSVKNRLNGFFSNLVQGIVLVGLVILLTIGIRGSVIVMLAIPFSLLIGIGFVDLSGYGLQQMTIAGLVITLGLLVDNAIVVTENISRFIRLGENNLNAAIKGSRQIGWAIVSATATTVLAFIPIVMMQDISGEFIRSMPLTVIYTLLASLLIALTFTPYLSIKILKKEKRENRFQIVVRRFIQTRYRRWLQATLKRPGLVIGASLAVFLASLALFPLIGVSFFPKAEKPLFFVDISTPEGTALEKTDRVAKFAESLLKSHKEIKQVTTSVGRTNPRIYYNVMDKQGKSTIAHIFVQLKRISSNRMKRLIENLRREFSIYPGARIEIKELEQGPPVQAPVEIKILGRKVDVLEKVAGDIQSIFEKIPGLININNPLMTSKTDIQVNINREKAGMLGIPLAEVDRTIRMAVAGLGISSYRDRDGKEYDIVIRSDVVHRPDLSVFEKIYLPTATGASVPLNQIASLELKSSPARINHFNLERSVTVTADVLTGFSVNRITGKIVSQLKAYQWPDGYDYYVGGEKESQEQSFGGMGKAVIIAIIAIFAVLVLQFRSFTQPLIVFSALPLAVIGSILALVITGNTFSFTAFIGLTSLVGIVVNNSIILVDYSNQLRQEGRDLLTAVREAAETRFIPIILTTATTIGGLLPLTLQGGSLWAPMGWTIIGGLLTSTLLTLIVVPALYRMFSAKS
jgi:multidrug efflux pump subunit AcrB